LDQSQIRLCTAIVRHLVLVMAALAICAVTAALVKDRTSTWAPPPAGPGQPPPADLGMVLLTSRLNGRAAALAAQNYACALVADAASMSTEIATLDG